MKSVLVSALFSLIVSILVTPLAIKAFRRRGFGQEIRDDGPESHLAKRGTPTMGGAVIILATVCGYIAAHIFTIGSPGAGPSASGLLVLYLMVGLGVVGFLDDFIKLRKQRSLGLNKTAKLTGQTVISVSFAILALRFRNSDGLTPASSHLSYVRDLSLNFGVVIFVIFALLLISGFSNAVNLTDGLDGLAAGSSAMVFASYLVISFFEFRNACGMPSAGAGCYTVRDPLDLTLVAAAAMFACFGFLWWNANPARIIMGDTGSLALGGLIAALAMTTRTELLLFVLGGLFVVETLSVVMQVAVFKARRKRLFKMAPIHHHFELAGWAETTVTIRFWILAGLAVAFGLGLFYAEYLTFGLPL